METDTCRVDLLTKLKCLDLPVKLADSITKWKLLKYTEADWCKVFGERILKFRKGTHRAEHDPYWESKCQEEFLSLQNFFRSPSYKVTGSWLYFDYKYMENVFEDNLEFLKEVRWSDIGLNKSGRESTMWIGNQGSHTPCHMDTYGCNLVAQIYGRKRWILMPPSQTKNLKPVRVPYEESSIYSSINFYTPCEDICKIEEAYAITLEPGDVLFVPRHWWHFVENLEVAISINCWIPLQEDITSQLDEALAQFLVSMMCQELSQDEAKLVLNPNQYELLSEPFNLTTLQNVFTKYMTRQTEKKGSSNSQLEHELPLVTLPKMHKLKQIKMEEYLIKKQKELQYVPSDITSIQAQAGATTQLIKAAINSFCDPQIITCIRDKFVGEMSRNCK